VDWLAAQQDSTDRYGDAVTTWAPAVPIAGAVWAPGATSETASGGEQVTADATVYLPKGSPTPGPLDRISYGGDLWEVTGQPDVFTSPAAPPGAGAQITSVRLRRVQGVQKAR
jgi:hypothetical protein